MTYAMFTLRLVLQRELQLIWLRRTSVLLPLAFFVLAASLFPLGVGPEPQTLRQIAPGIVWVCALMASLLALHQFFATDHADGSLDQMLLSRRSLAGIAASKALAHWLYTGVPLMLLAPLLGVMFDLSGSHIAVLELTLLLGTPTLSSLACFAAALTLGLRHAAVLGLLLVLPLCIPVLIFSTAAVSAVDAGLSPNAHLSLLAATTLALLPTMPFASAAALRIAQD